MRRGRAGWPGAVLAVALLAAAGCSAGAPTSGEVIGTVTVDKKPAESGSVAFIPADGKSPTAGAEIKAGKYTATVPLGLAKVEIRVQKKTGRKQKLYDTPDSPYQEILEEMLPTKYNNETELKFEVKAGRNEKNWELMSK